MKSKYGWTGIAPPNLSLQRTARVAGQILVANVVRELAEGKEFMFSDRGETALRGFDDPVRLFEVRWRG